MGQTLTHGVYLPDEGERNCYSGLAANWQILDGSVGTIAAHTAALSGKAPLVHTHTKSQITDFPAYGTTAGTICEGNDSRLSDARTPVAHTHTKSDVTDLLNSNFIPSSDANYTLGSSDLRWKQIWAVGYKAKFNSIDFTDSTTTGSIQNWWVDTSEKNGTSFFGVGSIRAHSFGLNEEHFRIKNAGGKWADLYIQLGDNNQFTIGTAAHSDVTNNGFRGKFTPLDSFIPNANNSYDLGSSSYQWNNLYAKNYYYNGVAWGLDKANVWSAWQTQEHTTEPLIRLRRSNLQIGDPIPASQQIIGTIPFADKNNLNLGLIACRDNTNGDTYLTLIARQRYDSNGRANNGTQYESRIDLGMDSSQNLYLRPNSNGQINLGTSTNKWKTLNGINPGALSLPNSPGGSGTVNINYFDLSGNITVRDGSAPNGFTALCDGWIAIESFATWLQISNDTLIIATTANPGADGFAQAFLPVRKGNAIRIVVNQTNTQFQSFKLLPCEGNV